MEKNDLHPNWRALATVHYPLKIFVAEGSHDSVKLDKPRYKKNKVDGKYAKQFYDDIVNTASCKEVNKSQNNRMDSKAVPEIKVPFDKNKFFKAATNNDVKCLEAFSYLSGDVDSTDNFGWTALMMAACEGSRDAVSYLLKLGANVDVSDKKGNSAFSLADFKGFSKILRLLGEKKTKNHLSEKFIKAETVEFYCEICKQNFKNESIKSHETSTLHQFSRKNNHRTCRRFNISEKNQGLKLMVKQGWDRNSGLGPNNNGQLYPIKTVIRKDRTGLGVKQNDPKITHFDPYDLSAIKYKSPVPKKTRKDFQRARLREKFKERKFREELG